MTDLSYFEAQVEDAQRAFVQAEAARSGDANQLYANYLSLQAEYNHAWTADQRERHDASREGVGLAAAPVAPFDITAPEEMVDAEPLVAEPASVRARGGRRDIAGEVTNKIIEQLEAVR